MDGWLTPIQKIALTLLIAVAVGGVVYTAVTEWANNNKDIITTPKYTLESTRDINEAMA